MSKTLFEASLTTPEAKAAIQVGIATFVQTWDLDKAWDAMMEAGKRNGALPIAQAALVIDILKLIVDALSSKDKRSGI